MSRLPAPEESVRAESGREVRESKFKHLWRRQGSDNIGYSSSAVLCLLDTSKLIHAHFLGGPHVNWSIKPPCLWVTTWFCLFFLRKYQKAPPKYFRTCFYTADVTWFVKKFDAVEFFFLCRPKWSAAGYHYPIKSKYHRQLFELGAFLSSLTSHEC